MGEYDKVVGVLLIGVAFNTYLYGLVTYQFLVYRNSDFNDALWIRTVVWTLFTIDSVHSAVGIYAVWNTCVENYGNPESLIHVSWTIPFLAAATALAAIITQFFLSHRVYQFTKNKFITGAIMLLSVVGFIFAIYAATLSVIVKLVTNFGRLHPSVTCWLVLQTTADLSITITLSIALWRSRTGFRNTDTVINRLIRGAIQTGLFASIFALADLYSFLFHGNTSLYAMFAYPIGRIYTNTLMDTLNARAEIRSLMMVTVDMNSESTPCAFQVPTGTEAHAMHTIHSMHVQKSVTSSQLTNTCSQTLKYGSDEDYMHSKVV